MKGIKKILTLVLSILLVFTIGFAVVGCDEPQDPGPTKYNVTFTVENTQYGEVIKVQKGRRITNKPADPTFSNASYVFTGWYTSSDFAEGTLWNFTTGIVNGDLTLYAGYKVISEHVTEVAKVEEPVTSKLEWTQVAPSDASAYEVKIIDKAGVETSLTGTVSFNPSTYRVTFTPSVIPQGGKYTVSIKDTTKSASACVVENVLLCGAGTVANPYLIGSALDFTAISKANVAQDTQFRLFNNITIEAIRSEQAGFEFNGTLIGNGKTITLENSNAGAIYKIGANGSVYNLGIAGTVSTSSFDSVGSLADFNAGKVEKIRSTANVTSTSGAVGSSGLAATLNTDAVEGTRGIAGGIVGTNLAGAEVYNCTVSTSSSSTGTVKASIAGGVIVGLNYGKIEMCTGDGCLGAWNSKETGKSLSNYSYGGAIVGINAGQVLKCAVTSSGKVLGQRYTVDSDVTSGANNANLGGIAGYNMENATISECYFAGVRVHGDENVGGIAGLNAGAITDCYVEGAYQSTAILSYIGGRTNIGGIVGKMESTGSVANCYSTANVFAYGTDATAYALAQSATNSIYVTANPNTSSKDDGKANPTPATLTAPTGTDNVAVEVTAGSFDGVASTNMVLAESNLATINSNNKFFFNSTTIKLNFETAVLPEETIEIALYNADGTAFKTVEVAETGKAIAGPVVKGYKFVGWATEQGGEVVYDKTYAISYYDILDLESVGTTKLYAVMEARQENEGLIVAVWGRYIDETNSAAIKQEFESYIQGLSKSYTVEFRVYIGDEFKQVADFCAGVNNDGDIDVIIGAGNTVNASNGIDYIARADMITAGFTDRKAALLTDTERAEEFFGWITGRGTASATINFVVNGNTTIGTVSELLGTSVSAPSVDAPTGFEFIGWATEENATAAQVTVSSLNYAAVQEYLTSGAVTFYPVFEEVISEPAADTTLKVSVWTKGGSWVTADELNAIKSGFETYLIAEGIDLTTITITYVEAVGTKVADLVNEVNTAGDFDFVIGCGKSSGDLVYKEKEEIGAHVFAAGRYIARLTDNTLAVQLYEYITSIPAPAAQDTTLKVSVWTKGGSWVKEDELASIKSGFESYLTGLGIDVTTLTLTYVETATSGVAALGQEVNTAGDFDIIIGCGTNVTTTGGVTTLQRGAIATEYVAAGRQVARLTANTLAVQLYDYLTTFQA